MDLKTEEIIKILLILGVLYLLLNCIVTEKFTQTEKIRLALLSEGKVYRLVSFLDLKDEYKKIFIEILKLEYNEELQKNTSLPQEKKTNNSFLASGIENAIITYDNNDNVALLSPRNISKIPILIIHSDNLSEYTKNTFKISPLSDKGLSPEPDKFIYWNEHHQLMFYSGSSQYGKEIKGLPKIEDKNKLEIEPIFINNKEIKLSKMIEKSKTIDNKKFTYYVVSQDQGQDFVWKWYTDDLSKIL